jgi:hypothetical protein
MYMMFGVDRVFTGRGISEIEVLVAAIDGWATWQPSTPRKIAMSSGLCDKGVVLIMAIP